MIYLFFTFHSTCDKNYDRIDVNNNNNNNHLPTRDSSSRRQVIIPIIVGSTLQLSFTGHGCNSISINGIDISTSSSSSSSSSSSIGGTSSIAATSTKSIKKHNNNTATTATSQTINKDKNKSRLAVINQYQITRNSGEISIQALSTLSIDIVSNTSSPNDNSYEEYAYIKAHSHLKSTKFNDNINIGNNHSNSSSSYGDSRGRDVGDDDDTNECTISLTALKSGLLTLNVHAIISEYSNNSVEIDKSSVVFRQKSCQIQIILVPEYLTDSLLLLDLIGHLEECHKLQDPTILLHSQLFHNKKKYSMITTNHNATIHSKNKGDIQSHNDNNNDHHHHDYKNDNNREDFDEYDNFINNSELQKSWQIIKETLLSPTTATSSNSRNLSSSNNNNHTTSIGGINTKL